MEEPVALNGTRTLRRDFRQWLIYDEPSVGAVVRALEVVALGMVGRRFAQHQNISVRALGNVMARLAEARLRCALGLVKDVGTTPERRLAMEWAMQVAEWANNGGVEPVGALDELHAAVFHLDSRLNSAGLAGPGWIRDLGRGD